MIHVKPDRLEDTVSCTRTLKFKVRPESYAWLNAAAIEVNQVWNWANEVSANAADRNLRANAKWLKGYDILAGSRWQTSVRGNERLHEHRVERGMNFCSDGVMEEIGG